jgi:hypothetical protein
MDNKLSCTIFYFVFLVLIPNAVHSQSDTLIDVMPLAIGNQWTYQYHTSIWDNSGVIVIDSGIAVYNIVSYLSSEDSTRWVFLEQRNLYHSMDYSFDQQPDTGWPVSDSIIFEIIEIQKGQHRLYRNQPENTIWHSIFPWSHDLSDSLGIYRYSRVDSSGRIAFQIHSDNTPYSWLYDLTFQRDIGLILTNAQTSQYVVGIVYNSDHRLLNSIINSVPERTDVRRPTSFVLGQNYPNPFNPSTTFSFAVPYKSHMRITITNPLGQQIVTVVDKEFPAGSYTQAWNASNLPSGIYFYRMQVDGIYIDTKKFILLK